MTELITADLHLTSKERDGYRHALIGRLRAVIKKHQVSTLYILGDLTEEKDRHSAWLVNRIVDHLFELTKLCKVVISRGNHDYLDINNPFFEFVGRLSNITWINQPTKWGERLILPHTRNYEQDWKGVNLKARLILAHNTFEGAKNSNGFKLPGIPLSVFPKDSSIISGDIHVPQTIGPLTYVGAPYRINYGDDYEPRVILLEGKGQRSILMGGPKKWLLEVSSIPELDKSRSAVTGDMIKVRFHLGHDEYPRWSDIRRQVMAWGEKNGAIIDQVRPVVGAQPTAGKIDRKVSVLSDVQTYSTYCKNRKLDKELTIVGEQLLRMK